MTEQQSKAEAYVRKAIPELLEFREGCMFYDPNAIDWARNLKLICYNPKGGRTHFSEPDGSTFHCTEEKWSTFTRIGHPIHPHHWLQAIVEATKDNNWMLNARGELVNMKNFGNKHFKNEYLIIGTERFYKAFNEIVGV